ncbi:hypothetical protein BZA70DRAFT_277759 [Myxozyma melibiosi]|uniref:Uncharacterized protein n=1 Tax=Myxozyma melibiosi TaxID=54550 RepID=A0ABR1F656_9ASCO
MQFSRTLFAPVQDSALVYLMRFRQGPVVVGKTNHVTGSMIRKQLPPTRVPKASRVHDWSILCVARLPEKSHGPALIAYLHELRRKRERLYESNHELREQWMHTKFPKRHVYTYEAVSDLATALDYLYKRPTVDELPRIKVPPTKKVHQPYDVRRPQENAVVYWPNEWFMGKDELWPESVEHKKIDVTGMGENDMVGYLIEYENEEEAFNQSGLPQEQPKQ